MVSTSSGAGLNLLLHVLTYMHVMGGVSGHALSMHPAVNQPSSSTSLVGQPLNNAPCQLCTGTSCTQVPHKLIIYVPRTSSPWPLLTNTCHRYQEQLHYVVL
jgi:hypothetical protein